jgi:hypothetical protein
MAIYRGDVTSSAGAMIAILDTELVKDAAWSIFDAAAGTNKKVYSCYTVARGYFYLIVDDNFSGYYTTAITDNWDAITHSVAGVVTSTLYHSKVGERYCIWLNDHRVIIGDLLYTTDNSYLSYHGHLLTHPNCDSAVITCGGSSSSYDELNHVGSDGTGFSWKVLYDPLGASDVTVYIFGRLNSAYALYRCRCDKDGVLHPRPTSMYAYGGAVKYNLGWLDGVILTGNSSGKWTRFSKIVFHGTDWEFHRDANWGSFIRMN